MKHRIVIVNKFYYSRGGDCVCALNLEKMLRALGHEVAVFAMNYPENIHSEYTKYFASEVSFSGGISAKLAAAKRVFGKDDVVQKFERLLSDFKPDIVHLHNIHSYLSPVVAEIAKRRGCKVVWTMHDYKLLCPSYSCLRDGKPCELCFTDKTQVVKNKCMKGMAGSMIGYLEAKYWNRDKLQGLTDAFVCPSSFLAQKMAQGGFAEDKLKVVCNPVDVEKLERFRSLKATGNREPYYCYIGRLSEEKGVDTMLHVASKMPYRLKVAGDGPLANEMKQKYANCPNIEFLGRLDAKAVSELLVNATASVIPSEWYENNPLGVIESLCAGTPVVGARIGGIPELIDDGVNGVVFESGDADSLVVALNKAFEMKWDNASISEVASKRFAPDTYMQAVLGIYDA